jgi:calcium-dependent protein kinase
MGCSSTNTSETKKLNRTSLNKLKSYKIFKKDKDEFFLNYKYQDLISNNGDVKITKVLHLPTNQIRVCKQIYKTNIVKPNKVNENTKNGIIEKFCEIDDHLNLQKIFEYFEDEISYFVINEFSAGKELLKYIEYVDNFTERQVAIIMEQLFSCLNHLHDNDIIHCNVMPENIILDSEKIGDYHLKLINFEESSILSFEKNEEFKYKNFELDGIKYGQYYFLSPERLLGKRDFKDDMWSTGIIMYLLLCGNPPFVAENLEKLLELIRKGKLPFIEKDWTNISKEAKTLVENLLNLNPKKRFSSKKALNDPWIINQLKVRNIENERKFNVNSLQINKKIKKFSSTHYLESAVMAFIVRQMSTNQQANELRDIFKLMDCNRDGRLTYEELTNGYKKFFLKKTALTQEEYMEIIKSFDRDGSEYVEFEEFLGAFLKQELILTEKNLKFAFDYFDDDKSGYLSADEIKKILSFNNCNDNNKLKINEIVKNFDKDSDGQISVDEFIDLMKKNLVV